ncbi:unnamed protein product [Caenorhabditis bovis]|uniref:Uncharacterized protein n=1 Tax=Caenorhabditis bovis TaxID=2654633 RepID=A0A8S1EY11_9PELO|nr:unnamed protein product [Caenorhabditis bovis]
MISPFAILVSIFPFSAALIAYDKANEFLNIPENEIRVITPVIENFKPKLHVQFINFQNIKRRKASRTKNGQIRIETHLEPTVENVTINDDYVKLRFGGASKSHFPYNRVIGFESNVETTSTTTWEAITPRNWATTSAKMPNYSAEPALFLPSRFHKNQKNVVIVFKKPVKLRRF